MNIVRVSASSKRERPACFGHPSLVDAACRGCRCSPACFKRYSKPLNVRVLARPKVDATKLVERPEAESSLFGSAGMDYALYAKLATTVVPLGCVFRRAKSNAYAGYFVYNNRKVIGIKRLDARDIVLDFWCVDVNAAAMNGAKINEGTNGKTSWRLRIDPQSGVQKMVLAVGTILAQSYLEGVLGKTRQRRKH